MFRTLVRCACVLLVTGALACSDDDKPGDDSAVKQDKGPAKVEAGTDMPIPDQTPPVPDKGVPDQPVPDANLAKVLDNTHTGWGNKHCFTSGCHTDPPSATHQKYPDVSKCAQCHGGNGSCTPPSSHAQGMSCLSGGCHGPTHHGFSAKTACIDCHYAAAGTAKCP